MILNACGAILGVTRQELGELEDRVFVVARQVVFTPGLCDIHIDSSDRSVVLDESVRKHSPELATCPTVSEVRAGLAAGGTLLSSGAFVRGCSRDRDGAWFERCALLQRYALAPTDPLCYTGPAGRCDASPSQTALRETNEELLIVDGTMVIGFVGCGIDRDEAILLKQMQWRAIFGQELAAKDICLHRVDDMIATQQREDSSMLSVRTFLDGELRDEMRGFAFLDQATRTLEVRMLIDIDISPEARVFDTEGMSADIGWFTPDEMRRLPKVFALKAFCETVFHGE